VPPSQPVEELVTYHDPCHLARGLSVRAAPRAILAAIPGLTLVEHEEADRCCGGGGTFSFSHRPLSKRIQERKLGSIARSGAGVIATGCPGCKYQLNDGLQRLEMPQRVVHTIQLLARGYGLT
jgi:Fe-S oxidoreductase